MKNITIIFGAIFFITVAAFVACNSSSASSSKTEGIKVETIPSGNADLIKRGEYLVSIMGCNDCHTPMIMTPKGPGIDSSRMLSGHPSSIPLAPIDQTSAKSWAMFSLTGTAMAGPWGVSYAANLTSDATGIGSWTEAQFFNAIRKGKYKGLENSRTLLPPMPWQGYARASDDDLRAVFAYLKSTRPVMNRVPAPIPPDQIAKLYK